MARTTKSARTVEALRAQIREAGLRVTAPRVSVLQRLEGASSPLSHAEIADALGPSGWDRATIYRNLMDLTEAGMLRRSDMGDHVWRFERVQEDRATGHTPAAHPHFVCDTCGDVSCLPGEAVEVHASRDTPRSLKGGAVEIQVKGRCDRCA